MSMKEVRPGQEEPLRTSVPEQHVGELQNHKVTNQTGQVESFAEKVPTTNFRNPEGTFELTWETIKTALRTGGVGYTLSLILSYFFPTFKKPVSAGELGTQLIGLSTKGKTINDSEVQQVLGQMFPSVETLEAEWQRTKNREDKIPSFLVKYEKTQEQINSVSDALPFVEEKKADLRALMETIKKEALGKVLPSPLEALNKQFDEAKQVRNTKPAQFLSFSNELERTIVKLEAHNTSYSRIVQSEKEKQLSELKELQTQLTTESVKGRQEAQEALQRTLPFRELQTFANGANLQMKESFAESVISIKEEIKQRHQVADQEVTSLRESNTQLERSIRNMDRALKEDMEKLKLKETNPEEVDNLNKRQLAIEEDIKYLDSLEAGEVKEFFFTKAFTEQDRQKRDNLKKELNGIATRLEVIQQLQNDKKAVAAEAQALDETRAALKQQELKYDNAIRAREKVEQNSERLDQILKSVSGKKEFTNYTTLLFIEGALESYEKIPIEQRLDSETFLQTYKSNSAVEINTRLKRGLEENFGYVPDALQRDAQNVL